MLYPIYVHQEGDSAYGASFPDVPGCFTAADTLDELPAKAQEALEVHFEGEDMALPAPSSFSALAKRKDLKGGHLIFVDIDVSQINSKPVRLNISLPAGLVNKIDAYAAKHSMNRSAFLARAAAEAMHSR